MCRGCRSIGVINDVIDCDARPEVRDIEDGATKVAKYAIPSTHAFDTANQKE